MESRVPETINRITSLPDEIISHVLSFLPTKYAVATVALSRQWKDLSTSLRNLDFDNRLVRSIPLDSGEAKRRDLEFSRFVGRVLSQQKNLNFVKRFRFQFSVDYYDCEARAKSRCLVSLDGVDS
ncbi:unnamed protein product [Linum trigynum]|uniref:F-box domain-containing protein n=1 Tax=Linum trigynum TaxID=586398 RepID=A0AAV2GPV3_9ROSI